MQRKGNNGNSRVKKVGPPFKTQPENSLSSLDWSRLTPEDLGVYLHGLPLSQRLAVILKLHGRQRQDIILLSRDPAELVHALPEEELLMTIKEIGEEDALPVISLTSHRQIRYLMDIDLWVRDQLTPSRALQWLTLILECGEDKVMQWVQSLDEEMVASVFHAFMHVTKPEQETAPPDHGFTQPYTVDNIYYLCFRETEVIPTVARFIEIIRRRDENFYLWLMEELIWGTPAEREELALKWRQARLDEKGFPSLDEALGLYQYVTERELERIRSGAYRGRERAPAAPLMPGWFLRSLRQSDSLLSSALARVEDPDQIDRLHREFIHLCNMCMLADAKEPGDLDDIRVSTEKVLHFLEMGLEIISGADPRKAADALTGSHLQLIFRVGYTQALQLRLEALDLLKSLGADIPETGATILGHRLEGLLAGVCRKRPLFYQGHEGVKGEIYREFSSLSDIGVVREALETIREVDRMMRSVLGWPGGLMGAPPLEVARIVKAKGLTAQEVILTAMARLAVEGRFRFAPLSLEDARNFFQTIYKAPDSKLEIQTLKEKMARAFAAWLRVNWEGATDQGIAAIQRFVEQSLQTLIEQTAHQDFDLPVEPKSITALVIEDKEV